MSAKHNNLIQLLHCQIDQYACSKKECYEIMLSILQNHQVAKWLVQKYWSKKMYSSKFKPHLSKISFFGESKNLSFPVLASNIIQSHRLDKKKFIVENVVIKFYELIFWQGNFIEFAKYLSVSLNILIYSLIWSAFMNKCFDGNGCWITTKKKPNFLFIEILSIIKITPLQKGSIHVLKSTKSKFSSYIDAIKYFEKTGGNFKLLHLMQTQKISRLNLEWIDWSSMPRLFEFHDKTNAEFFVKMLQILGFIYDQRYCGF